MEAGGGDAAAAVWIFRRDGSRLRRGKVECPNDDGASSGVVRGVTAIAPRRRRHPAAASPRPLACRPTNPPGTRKIEVRCAIHCASGVACDDGAAAEATTAPRPRRRWRRGRGDDGAAAEAMRRRGRGDAAPPRPRRRVVSASFSPESDARDALGRARRARTRRGRPFIEGTRQSPARTRARRCSASARARHASSGSGGGAGLSGRRRRLFFLRVDGSTIASIAAGGPRAPLLLESWHSAAGWRRSHRALPAAGRIDRAT